MVVGVGLAAADGCPESLAGCDGVVVGLVVVGEQRTLHQVDIGARPGRIAERLGDSARGPDPPNLADCTVELVGLFVGTLQQRLDVRAIVTGGVSDRHLRVAAH